jgi:hypothetical protein
MEDTMIKYFLLEDSETPGIAKVEVIDTKGPISTVKVIEIVRKSTFRPCKVGQKLKVANTMLHDTMP